MTKKYNELFHETHSWKTKKSIRVEITPELACDLLSLNSVNRPLRKKIIDFYASEMKEGRWKENGDVIRVSKEGLLIDGQHRLNAIIKSQISCFFYIVSGVDQESFSVIDVGKNRTGGDIVSLMGFSNANNFSSFIKLLMYYQANKGDLSNSKNSRISNEEMRHFIKSLPDKKLESMQNCITKSNALYKRFRFVSVHYFALCYWVFSNINQDQADLFMNLLVSGDGVGSSNYSSIFLLRKRFFDMSAISKTRFESDLKIAYIVKAWNLFRQNKECKILYWDDKQDFPIAK